MSHVADVIYSCCAIQCVEPRVQSLACMDGSAMPVMRHVTYEGVMSHMNESCTDG